MQLSLIAGVIGAVAGALAGWAIRRLLGAVPRGTALRPGIAETGCALITGLGLALAWPGPTAPLVVWAGLLGVALGSVDIAVHRLPDALTLPAIPITVLLLIVTEVAVPGTGSLLIAGVVGLAGTGLFWALAALAPRAMGLGDVKLVPSLALLTGYLSVATAVLAVLLAFVLGAAVALIGLLFRRLTLTSSIPFGPFLLAGCWLVLAIPSLVRVVIG